jgi:hypothetical protein
MSRIPPLLIFVGEKKQVEMILFKTYRKTRDTSIVMDGSAEEGGEEEGIHFKICGWWSMACIRDTTGGGR